MKTGFLYRTRILAIILVIANVFFINTAIAQVSLVSGNGWTHIGTNTAGGNPATQTTSYTINSGSNRLLVVGVEVSVNSPNSVPTTKTVTWGDKTLTFLSTNPNAGNRVFAYFYYLKESDIASASGNSLVVTMGGFPIYGFVTFAAVYQNVDQSTPVRNGAWLISDTNTHLTATQTANFTSGDQGIFLAGFGLKDPTATAYSSTVSGWTGSSGLFAGNIGNGGAFYGGIGTRNGTGAATGETVSMTVTVAERTSMSIVSLVPIYTFTWDGGGADNNWTTAANWVGDVAPSAGYNLVFNATGVGARPLPNNDFTAGTSFVTITVAVGGYTIGGNSVSLTTGLTASNASGTSTVSLVVGGAGTVTKSGAGTLTLSGANTYTGATTVSAGVLNIRNATALGTTAAGTDVTAGAALQTEGGITVGAEALTLNGTGISADGALRNISGTNVWQGTVTLGNAVRINSDAGSLTFNTAANSITATNQNLTLGGAAGGTVSGTITTGSGTLTKDGAGTWTLSGANTYTGGSTLTAGTLVVKNTAGLGAAGQAIALNGGTLNLSTDATVNAYNTTVGGTVTIESDRATSGAGITHVLGTLSIGAQTLTINKGTNVASGTAAVSFGNLTLTGAATFNTGTADILMTGSETGNFKLTKSGAGTLKKTTAGWTLANAFEITAGTYDANGQTTTVTGLATVSGGEYKANTASQTFNGALTVSGGTFTGLSGTAGNVTTTGLTLSSGTLSAPGSSGTFNVSGDFSNSGTFTHNSGTVTLNGATQAIGGSAVTTFKSLTLGGTGAKTANKDINVSGALTVNQPLIMSGANVLTMLNGASQPTFSGLTEITGTMTWQAYNAAAYTFNNAQTIVTFTGADGARTFTMKSIPDTYPSFGTVLAGHTVKRNFNVSYSGWSTGTATLRLAYLQGEGSTLGVTESRLNGFDGDIAGANRLTGNPTRSASGAGAFGYLSYSGLTSATLAAGELALDDRFGLFISIAAAAWNVATTWNQNDIPSALDYVIVDNNWPVTIPDGYTGAALSVIINATATGLTVGAGTSGALNIGTGGLTNSNNGTGLTVSPNAIVTITSGTLTSAGSITNNGTLTAGTAINGTGSLTQGVNSTLNIGGNCTISTLNASANPNTVNYNGTSGAQVIAANLFTGNTISNLTINNAAGVTLQGTLNITGIVTATSGDLATGGFLTLVSTASQTALINGSGTGNVTGNVTMQRYLPSGFGYKYFSSPFQAATVSEFGDDMNLGAAFTSFYRYDENRIIGGNPVSGWVNYKTPANVLNPLAGYAVNFGSNSAPNTVDVTGVVNNGNLSSTLYNNNNIYTTGFNLIGNPYPSPIDWDAASGWTKTNIDNALYYFKASTTDQYGGTYSTYINGISSDGLATAIIPSMQGFFVHVSNGAYPVTGTLGLNNGVRVTDLTHSFLKSGKKNSIPLLRLGATFDDEPVSTDPVVIYFNEKATEQFDSNFDALKLMNTDFKVPNLYALSADGKKLSIDALPFYIDSHCTVPLGIKTNKAGNIIFKISLIDDELTRTGIYLSDKVTGTNQNLLIDKEYKLYLNAGEYTNRFFLNMTSVPTEIPDIASENELFNIFNSHGTLRAEINLIPGENGTLTISNLIGKIIFINKIYDSGYYEFNPNINNGVYIVTLLSGNRRTSKKIVIRD